MLDIYKTAISRLVVALDGAKAQYRIILPDGTEYGALEVKPVKTKGQASKASPYPRGVLKAYVLGFIDALPLGGVALVPYGDYEPQYVAASCSSTAYDLWGKSGGMCARNANGVEVMRLA